MLDRLLHTIDQCRARIYLRASTRRMALGDLPEGLFAYWKRSARFEFTGIPQDAFFFVRAAEGLLIFFDCVKHGGKPCALPSRAADSVWHAWARHAPAGLDAFCRKHVGRTIPHVEAASMTAQMEDALLNCLVQARLLEAQAGAALALPRLFALDRKLKMPGGFWYRLASGQLAFSPMDRDGRQGADLFYPGSLAPVQLLAAGLLTQHGYDQYVRRATAGGPAAYGSSCASACDAGGASACGGACGGD